MSRQDARDQVRAEVADDGRTDSPQYRSNVACYRRWCAANQLPAEPPERPWPAKYPGPTLVIAAFLHAEYRLASHGLRVLVPEAADRAAVHRVIYDELCRGVIRAESRQVIERLVRASAQGVILGCTEIELLIGPADGPVPVFPTTRLHVQAAVDAALQGAPAAQR